MYLRPAVRALQRLHCRAGSLCASGAVPEGIGWIKRTLVLQLSRSLASTLCQAFSSAASRATTAAATRTLLIPPPGPELLPAQTPALIGMKAIQIRYLRMVSGARLWQRRSRHQQLRLLAASSASMTPSTHTSRSSRSIGYSGRHGSSSRLQSSGCDVNSNSSSAKTGGSSSSSVCRTAAGPAMHRIRTTPHGGKCGIRSGVRLARHPSECSLFWCCIGRRLIYM